MATTDTRYAPVVPRDAFEFDLIYTYIQSKMATWTEQLGSGVKITVDTDDAWKKDWDGVFDVLISQTTEKPSQEDAFDFHSMLDTADVRQVKGRAWVANDGGPAVMIWEIKAQPGIPNDQFNGPLYAPYIEWPFVPVIPPFATQEPS